MFTFARDHVLVKMNPALCLRERCLPRLSLDTLSKEQAVFSKMLYRGNNQHRHDKSFQKMNGVLRQIKKYLQWNLSAKVEVIGNQLTSTQSSVKSVQLLEEVYPQLLESAVFVADLLEFTEDTWSDVSQRLSMGHFIPFNTIMLAILSRIWVCLRVNLLGVSETYSVLKNAVPQIHLPVSRVVEHLKQCHRRYLDIPAVYLTPPLNSSATWTTPGSSRYKLKRCTPMSDTGVAIELTKEEQQARARDFQHHTPSTGSDWQPLPLSVSASQLARDQCSTGAIIGGKMRRMRRGLRGHHKKRLSQTQPNIGACGGLLQLTPTTSLLPAPSPSSQTAEGEGRKGNSSSQMTPVTSVSSAPNSQTAEGEGSSSQMMPVTCVSSTPSSQRAEGGGSSSQMMPVTCVSSTPSSQPAGEGGGSSSPTPPSLHPVRGRKIKKMRRRRGRGGRHKKRWCQTQPNIGACGGLLELTPTTSMLPAPSSQPAEGRGGKGGNSSQMTPVISMSSTPSSQPAEREGDKVGSLPQMTPVTCETSTDNSQSVETKSAKKVKKKKKEKRKSKQKRLKLKRLKRKSPSDKTENEEKDKIKAPQDKIKIKNCPSGNFRQIILRCSNHEKRIIGSKIWKRRMAKKITARQQREGRR